MIPAKRVAVIGAGPGGAIAADALTQEKVFDVIKVFERREKPGGCWIPDSHGWEQPFPDFEQLANRTADAPVSIPAALPAYTPPCSQYRFSDTSIYPSLETNIAAGPMAFSQEPLPEQKSAWSIARHGPDTPFRHHSVVQQYIKDLFIRKGYDSLVEFNTTVEHVQKVPNTSQWRLTLRKSGVGGLQDYWWTEDFDALVVASGHYSVPYIPHIEGLAEFAEQHLGAVEHSKSFRDFNKYKDKRVVVVGASISGPDLIVGLSGVTESPIHAIVRGRYHPYFGDYAFRNPHVQRRPPISYIDPSTRTVFLTDGTSISSVDHILLGTGYSWTLPFLQHLVPTRNNRVPDLYLHVFWRHDPTLAFVGATAAGFTFKVFEWQAVVAARYLAGRCTLPPIEEQERWEEERIALKGDGAEFTALYPDFEGYFETVRGLAGEPVMQNGITQGRKLPKFEKSWQDEFEAGHKRRIAMWQRMNRQAQEDLGRQQYTESMNGSRKEPQERLAVGKVAISGAKDRAENITGSPLKSINNKARDLDHPDQHPSPGQVLVAAEQVKPLNAAAPEFRSITEDKGVAFRYAASKHHIRTGMDDAAGHEGEMEKSKKVSKQQSGQKAGMERDKSMAKEGSQGPGVQEKDSDAEATRRYKDQAERYADEASRSLRPRVEGHDKKQGDVEEENDGGNVNMPNVDRARRGKPTPFAPKNNPDMEDFSLTGPMSRKGNRNTVSKIKVLIDSDPEPEEEDLFEGTAEEDGKKAENKEAGGDDKKAKENSKSNKEKKKGGS